MDEDVNKPDSDTIHQDHDSKSTDEFFSKDLEVSWRRWKCLNCGYVYEGANPDQICPRCGNNDPDRFDDVD